MILIGPQQLFTRLSFTEIKTLNTYFPYELRNVLNHATERERLKQNSSIELRFGKLGVMGKRREAFKNYIALRRRSRRRLFAIDRQSFQPMIRIFAHSIRIHSSFEFTPIYHSFDIRWTKVSDKWLFVKKTNKYYDISVVILCYVEVVMVSSYIYQFIYTNLNTFEWEIERMIWI